MALSKKDFEQGRQNFVESLGVNRRDFMRAAIAAPAGAGAAYFGYRELTGTPVRAGIVGVGNEGTEAMIKQSPPAFLEYVAYHDIRPSQVDRARRAFNDLYGRRTAKNIVFYDNYKAMLADPNIEAIVIATPLWTHASLTIEALKAGKHVFCEKLMAHNVPDAKEMVRVADQQKRLLGIGHQRHYSTLYADALHTIQTGVLGDVKHIRAFWHRNNTIIDPKTGEMMDSWRPAIPEEDKSVDAAKYGYKNVEELVRWRLFDRTGGGLMAELGSHQLDACSIFLDKAHPIAVTGAGGKYFYQDDRECEDHVYCTFEFPDGVVVTYSSINTNAMEGYGEHLMGTRGSMMVLVERDVLLFNERDPLKPKRDELKKQQSEQGAQAVVAAAKKGESTMYSAASLGLPAQAAAASQQQVSRGYKEELEHFAFCIRNPDPSNKLRCDGKTALADAVMALVANIAIRSGARIEFKDAWYDPNSPEAPEAAGGKPVA
jgi:predicted dehydrogenase